MLCWWFYLLSINYCTVTVDFAFLETVPLSSVTAEWTLLWHLPCWCTRLFCVFVGLDCGSMHAAVLCVCRARLWLCVCRVRPLDCGSVHAVVLCVCRVRLWQWRPVFQCYISGCHCVFLKDVRCIMQPPVVVVAKFDFYWSRNVA